MQKLIVLIIVFATFNSKAQEYLTKIRNTLDGLKCCYPDSVIQELDSRNFDKKKILKDQFIISKFDSLFQYDSLIFSMNSLRKIFGKKIKLKRVELEPGHMYYISGGYLSFRIGSYRIKGIIHPYSEIYSLHGLMDRLSFGRQNKMRLAFQPKPYCDEIVYYINYLYFYKYIDPIMKNTQLRFNFDYMEFYKDGWNWEFK